MLDGVLPTANGGTGHSTPVVVSAKPASDQTIAPNGWREVALGTENIDTANAFANSEFTPPETGYYMVHGSVNVSCSAANEMTQVFVKFSKGGTFLAGSERGHQESHQGGGNNDTNFTKSQAEVTMCLYLTPSDTIKLYAFSNSGAGTLFIESERTGFEVFKIS